MAQKYWLTVCTSRRGGRKKSPRNWTHKYISTYSGHKLTHTETVTYGISTYVNNLRVRPPMGIPYSIMWKTLTVLRTYSKKRGHTSKTVSVFQCLMNFVSFYAYCAFEKQSRGRSLPCFDELFRVRPYSSTPVGIRFLTLDASCPFLVYSYSSPRPRSKSASSPPLPSCQVQWPVYRLARSLHPSPPPFSIHARPTTNRVAHSTFYTVHTHKYSAKRGRGNERNALLGLMRVKWLVRTENITTILLTNKHSWSARWELKALSCLEHACDSWLLTGLIAYRVHTRHTFHQKYTMTYAQ